MTRRRSFLLAYDATCDRRRRRFLEIARAFGIDAQLSVLECRLSEGEARELWSRLVTIARADEDCALLARLDPRRETIRRGTAAQPEVARHDPDGFFYFG